MRDRFVASRRVRWDRLTALVDRAARRGVRTLAPAEIDELALDYRAATSDLAIAQTRGADPHVVDHLQRLVARAHAVVYVATARNGWDRLRRFVARDFPREFRRSWAPIGFCALLTVVAAIVAYTSVTHDPANARALLPGMELPSVDRALHDSNFAFNRADSPIVASSIIANNVRVAAIAFAGGITGGLLTVWIILENALMLGVYGALFAQRGFGADFWATIAPHGVIELTSIQIAGGAGLVLAGGYLRPGRVRRRDALVLAGRRAATLIGGVTLLLLVAGTIEGFITPQRISIPAREAVGAATAVVLALYLFAAGRGSEQAARLDGDVGVEQRDGEPRGGDVDHQDPAVA
jgi:uncharacterized membrane protein SpoIIM required for sporulation